MLALALLLSTLATGSLCPTAPRDYYALAKIPDDPASKAHVDNVKRNRTFNIISMAYEVTRAALRDCLVRGREMGLSDDDDGKRSHGWRLVVGGAALVPLHGRDAGAGGNSGETRGYVDDGGPVLREGFVVQDEARRRRGGAGGGDGVVLAGTGGGGGGQAVDKVG